MSQIELDTDIVKTAIIDKDGKEVTARFIEVIVNIPTKIKVPLYKDGEIISSEKLAEYNLSKKEYTRLQVETTTYGNYYNENPTLAARVKQYKNILDSYSLAYDSTSDVISNAIQTDQNITQQQKTMLGAKLLSLIHDIEINFQEVTGNGLQAWSHIQKLIKYLPVEE